MPAVLVRPSREWSKVKSPGHLTGTAQIGPTDCEKKCESCEASAKVPQEVVILHLVTGLYL